MAWDPSDAGSLDPRWELVACDRRDALGRLYHVAVPRRGARFGGLVVLEVLSKGKGGRVRCRCDCEGEWVGEFRALRRGKSRCAPCGIKRPDQARKHADLFPDRAVRELWSRRYTCIVGRCYDPNHRAYPNYGGRGIRLYGPWKRDRRKFFEYCAGLPRAHELGLDIDRIDNRRGYVPGNLRLVTRSENTRNTRATVFLDYEGERLSFARFWERFCPDWHRNAIQHHLDRGRSPEWIVARYRAQRGSVGPA